MKKIFFLIIFIFFLTGCYDYQELNSRAIVSGIGIDYKEDEFEVTLEILNTKKSESEQENTEKTYYVVGSGKTIAEAILTANLKVSKDPYYSHLKVMVISEDVAKGKLQEIVDYLLREPNIRNIFIPVLAEGTSSNSILKTISKANPVSSEAIENLVENNKASNHIALDMDFEKFIDSLVDLRKDAVINTIKKEEDQLVLGGIATFKGYEYKNILNEEEAALYMVLKNKSDSSYVKTKCDSREDKYIMIHLYENRNTDIEFKEDKILVKSNLKASIIEDECGFDFRNPESYPKVQELFDSVLKDKFHELLLKLKKDQTDILGINEANYKNERKELTDWYQKDVDVQLSLDINKNGLIFKVKHDK